MKFIIDTHTHTISSGHAYSTIQEMAAGAKNNGLDAFAMTDHGSSMKGAPFLYHFGNLHVVPEIINGVRIIKGVEANIIDYTGNIDMPVGYLKKLEFVMASFHDICISPGTVEENTKAMVNCLKNPYIDAVAHPGNPQFQVDIEKVVLAAKEYNKLLEINNHSFVVRTGSEKNCREFALKCKEHRVRITCGSDAHISYDIGRFNNVYKLLEEVNMPEELILNTSMKKLDENLNLRKERLKMIGI